ncbi:MAG: hypothetical protein U9R50_11765 [Campylobacterota bacterium]|nr:hypothetical protein [Campylobacterota bacterium]
MRMPIIFSFLLTLTLSANNSTCYSIQLMSVKEKYFDESTLEKYPLTCKLMQINNMKSIRCGCEESYRAILKYHNTLKQTYPQAQILKTYAYRFENPNPSEELDDIVSIKENENNDSVTVTDIIQTEHNKSIVEQAIELTEPTQQIRTTLPVIHDFLTIDEISSSQKLSTNLEEGFDAIKELRIIAKHSEDVGQDIEDSIALKIYPQHFTEHNMEKKYFSAVQNQYNNQLISENHKHYSERYTLLIRSFYLIKMREYTENKITILEKKLQLFQDSIEIEFDIKSIFKATEAIKQEQLSLLLQNQNISKNIKFIYQYIPHYSYEEIENELIHYDILSSNQIKISVDSYSIQDIFEKNLISNDNIYRLYLAKQKIKIAKASESINLDHIQFGYDLATNGEVAYTIRAGLNIPISGSNSADIALRKLNFNTLQNSLSQEHAQIQQECNTLKEEIINLSLYEKKLTQIINEDSFYTTYSQSDEVDLNFLLEMKEKHLTYSEKRLKVQEDIHLKYIALVTKLQYYDQSITLEKEH